MVRTRNFLVFLAAIGFLVVAIAMTLLLSKGSTIGTGYVSSGDFDMTTATYTAEVAVAPDERADRLATMRRKLSEIKTELNAPPEPVIAAADPMTSETPTPEPKPPAAEPVTLCATKRTQTVVWPGIPQQYAVRANQRVFFSETVLPPADASSSPVVQELVSVTLPIRTVALSDTACIASDVVAVTTTGLPIRNADIEKYTGVGASTLIGYSLDGFEIYGQAPNGTATDACGGATVSGVYRYYLSETRPGILGCFAAIPVVL